MKKLIIFLLLSTPTPIVAQSIIPLNVEFRGYTGNPLVKQISLLPADTLSTITAVARETKDEFSTRLSPQPQLSRSGLTLTVTFSNTRNLESGWVEVKIANITRFAGVLSVSKTPVGVSPQDASTLTKVLSNLQVQANLLDSIASASNDAVTTINQQLATKLAISTYTSNRTTDLNLIGQKLNISDSTAFQRKRSGWDLSQNNYTTTEKSKLAGLPTSVPDLATYTIFTASQSATNTTLTNNVSSLLVLTGTHTTQIASNSAAIATKADQATTYTKTEVDTKLLQYTPEYLVNAYADAVTLATGTDEKIFKVKADTDGCYSEYRYKNTSPEKDHLIFIGPYSCQKYQ